MAYPNLGLLQPASFRGVPFSVEAQNKESGRRTVNHEFPKSDTPYAEDMGRLQYTFNIIGYIIGPWFQRFYNAATFDQARYNLECALEDSQSQGPGVLILPTRVVTGVGSNLFTCQTYRTQERRIWGGYCEIEMTFKEYGAAPNQNPITATIGTISAAATTAINSASAFMSANLPI